jgi:asparagine synthase (glutamine-hydrolysing)
MCGLVATVSFDGAPAEAARLLEMSGTLAHRGPDDSGVATYGPVGFGFRRLAILDLSAAGHQPMESADGRYSIVFNGEVYNYVELKRELVAFGRTFRTSTDTEVLLQAYDQWGDDCVARFNGMWAFVIYDRVRNRLFASRDRFGVKPLYRWSDGKRLVLASEQKAIVASGWYEPKVNWSSASRFLHRMFLDEGAQTFYQDIEQVAPGTTLEIDLSGAVRERRFWSLADVHETPCANPVGAFRELFEDSVRLRMRSDVPVGVCLSGGVDSNAIISMMAALRPADVGYPLQAFSYIPDEFSEAPYINESVRRTQAILNTLKTTPQELWDLLPTALWHYDGPVHSPTALIGFQLMRLAKARGVTVVLNGQGADEVNGGYHVYFREYWAELMLARRWRDVAAEIAAYTRAHPRVPWRLMRRTFGHWVRTELKRHGQIMRLRETGRRSEAPATDWYTPEFIASFPSEPARGSSSLRETLSDAVERWPLPLFLRVEDRNSMAHSVEARLPFLDYRLVRLAFSLPSEWKLRGPWNKYLVREALKGVVAEPVRTRVDKMGFPTPAGKWLAGPWYEAARDLLATKSLRESGICNVRAVERDLERHRAGATDISKRLFHLAQFGVWKDGLQSARRSVVA